jgi:hypothetical protein
MNNIGATLAAAGLVVVAGAGMAQADNDHASITLYTSAIHTGVIACNAINVSKKTLKITISIIDGETGQVLNTPNPMAIFPGREATDDVGQPNDQDGGKEGYCVFQISGSSDRNDVRAVQNAVLAGTRSVDGGKTFFPFFITRVLEAH